jgi:hypothetical protein
MAKFIYEDRYSYSYKGTFDECDTALTNCRILFAVTDYELEPMDEEKNIWFLQVHYVN